MRRLVLALLAVTLAFVAGGCGSSSTSGASNPTLEALSYFPASTPLVLTVATDPKSVAIKDARSLEQRFPVTTLAQTAVFARLSQLGIDYNKDIRPLFGNPVAIGAAGSLSGTQTPFVLAWVTKSASDLSALLQKLHGLPSAGAHDGAKLYAAAGAAFAVDGATLVFARSTQDLESALDRHLHNQGFTSAQYARSTAGIAQHPLIQVFGNLTGVVSTSQTATARKTPWVAAIRGYGVSISAGSGGITIQYHIDTSGSALSTTQLPIASGSTAPSVAGDLPAQFGIRDPAQIVAFAESAERDSNPAGYARFLEQQAALKRKAGFDFTSLLAMLSGDLNVESDGHTTIARAQLSNPSAAASMVAKLAKAPALGNPLSHGAQTSSLGGGLYTVKTSTKTLTLGVIGNELAVGNATPAHLRAFATAPTTAAKVATGSVAFRIALVDLLRGRLKQARSPVAQQFLNVVGNLSGSASATTSGLTGTATLGLK